MTGDTLAPKRKFAETEKKPAKKRRRGVSKSRSKANEHLEGTEVGRSIEQVWLCFVL